MCGILVFKTNNLSQEIKKVFKSSLEGLRSRGPDELKVVESKNLLMGFTRLSINNIDNGSQPFKSLCGKYLIVFNGEIVNYKELAANLRKRKIKIKYGHEAEVILNLFILHGKQCVDFLRGFFAFVIVEIGSNDIFAAVDRFSIKPLYYYLNKKKNLFILTSDYSVLVKNGLIEKSLNFNKLVDYFTLARDFDNETIFLNLKKLEASTILIKNKNYEKTYKYWSPFKKNVNEIINSNNLIDIVHNKFLEVTNLWDVAETKISLCLSTGLDSQALNYYLHENKTNLSRYNLLENNKKFFQYNNTTKIKLNPEKIINLLNEFTKKSFNPFPLAHSSCTSLFQLYSLLKEKGFKFTINGEGADELYGGYERYNRQLNLIKSKKLSFSESILEIYKKDIENLSICLKKNETKKIKKSLLKKISSVKLNSRKIENKILEFDQICWIPVLIQRHDFIGMNYGLEVRPPYLDHELVDLCNSLPINLKYNFSKNKIILKKLLNEKFNYKSTYKKQGTPNIFEKILNNKNEMKNFKESLFNGELSKFFNCKKIFEEIINNYKEKNHIFLWRLYILNKMLSNF